MANKFLIKRGSAAPNNAAIDNYELVYNYTDNELWTKHNGSVVKVASGNVGTVTNVVAGNGLTGGGTTSATLDVGAGTGISVAADLVSTNDSQIVHDNLSGFVANEHIDHSGVSILAGTGLTGGGTIASSRTLNVVGENGLVASANAIGLDISPLSAVGANNLVDEDLFAVEIAVGGAIKKLTASSLKTYIGGGTITSVSGMTNNNVLTASGSTTISGESELTYNGAGQLEINRSGSNAILQLRSDTNNTRIHFKEGSDIAWNIGYDATNNWFSFYDSSVPATPVKIKDGAGSDTLVVDSNSRVGIGTASPSYSLHVIGTGQFSDDVRIGDDLVFNANANYIYQRDSVGTLTRVLGINGSNTTYIGPIDAYAGGRMYYGASANMSGHNFYTGGTLRMKLDGYVLDLPNTGDWSYIKNNTNSGGLRFGTKDSGGNYADQIEISNTGNYVKLNENTTVTGTMSVSSVLYGNQIDLTGELNFTGNGNKIIDVQTLEGNNYLLIRHHSTVGNQFENALKLTANGSAELYYNNSKKFETTNTGATVTGNIAVSGTVDGRDVASDGSKLDGIESGATADQSASEILTAIKTVDGIGSGLDADLLDGVQGASFLRSDATSGTITSQDWNTYIDGTEAHFHSVTGHTGSNRPTGAYTYGVALSYSVASQGKFQLYAPETATLGTSTNQGLWYRSGWNTTYRQWAKIWDSTNDGTGSGLDADLLDNIDSSGFLRSNVADTIGAQLTMGTQTSLVASNYGHGVFGVYSATKYQHVWSMGTAYKGPADGASTGNIGNLYGLAWSYNPDYGATGNNAQSKAGLSHQLLLANNGVTFTALGNGMWTKGHITIGTNNYALYGIDTFNQVRNLIKIDSSNRVMIGDASAAGVHHHYPSTYSQINTDYGYLQIGPQNVSHCHYTTDRANHWFNQMIYVNGGVFASYNSDLVLKRNGGTADRIEIKDTHQIFYAQSAERFRVDVGGVDVTGAITATSQITTDYGVRFNNGATDFMFYNNTGDNIFYLRDLTNAQMLQTWGVNDVTMNKPLKVASGTAESALRIDADAARGTNRYALDIVDDDTNGRGTVRIVNASGTGIINTTQGSNWNMQLVSADNGSSPAMSMGVRMQSFEGRANGHYHFDEDYSGQWFSGLRYAGATTNWQVGYRDGSSGDSPDYLSRARIMVDNNGNFHADADVIAYSSTIGSDIKLKKNVKDINYGLKDVLNIRAVEFDWKEKRQGKHDIGFIAQEIEKIIPEVVNEVTTIGESAKEGDTHKVVDYAKLTSVLIKAVQEQQQQINKLEEKLNG